MFRDRKKNFRRQDINKKNKRKGKNEKNNNSY